ncbi:MAG: DNA-binding transcriptional MerR regulator [Flavobacteriales bacterium]|jgi:DNA-binding transcriptional MerR regulator
MSTINSFSIGELSKRAKCSVPNIRYYEKIELLPQAKRSGSGHRYYNDHDTKRLTFIIRCRMLGFSIREISALLKSNDGNQSPCVQGVELAERRLNEVRASINELRCVEQTLMEYIDHDPQLCIGSNNSTNCTIMDSMEKFQ